MEPYEGRRVSALFHTAIIGLVRGLMGDLVTSDHVGGVVA